MAVRNRFRLGIDDELVGIFSARFAVERRAPSAKEFVQSFLWNGCELTHCFDLHRSQGRFCDAPDSRNAAHGKRLEEFGLGARWHPHQSARLGLVGRYLGNQTGARQARGARQSCFRADFG